METQKNVNLLNDSNYEDSKFATKKWYIIDSEAKGNYLRDNEVKFLTSSLESSLCDYSDAYILVTGNINVTCGNANTKVAFKNCAPFKKCRTEKNETFADEAQYINIAMLSSFKYKSNLIGDTVANGANRKKEGVKIIVPLKYISNFWRSLEMPLINCKVELSLEWYENCILSSAGTAAIFTITDTKLYVPVVTLKTEDNVKLSKLLREGFKRPIYWNKYKVISNKNYTEIEYIRERLDASIQGVNRLFVFPCIKSANSTTEIHTINTFHQD